jgi:UDP-glucose 4-epimerase
MTSLLAARRFLVTGGTGSFGQTMVARLLNAGAAEVRVFSRDEAKQDAMRRRLRDERVRYYVGDVRDFDAVLKAARDVEYVFHAAALKQVPSCEFFPLEAVRTNVLGSANVVEASERNGVTAVVMLSTDKAVYPVNAMGMTKALMEKVAQAHTRSHTRAHTNVSCVRYGNVMCSRGSVIPLFVDQAISGGPLTVTDPSMTRFLMSLEESVRLVEHAFAHATPGDLFVQKANACTIGDLATAVCRLFGLPERVELLGVRHGEKMSETLVSGEELTHAQDLGQYFRIPVDSRDLNYSLYVDQGDLMRDHRGYTSANAPRLEVPAIMAVLSGLPDVRRQLGAAAELVATAG